MDPQTIINQLSSIAAQLAALKLALEAEQAQPIPGYRMGGDANGTSRQLSFNSSYARIGAVLGEPASESDGYKVSTEWTLTEIETGACVTVYDYKSTSLYDPDYPSVAEFRAQPEYDWGIGAHNRAAAQRFATELRKAVNRAPGR